MVLGARGAGERHCGAYLGLLADTHVGRHLVATQHALNQQFQLAAGGFFAKQAGIHDAGVIEYHQVTGLQQRRQVTKNAVNRGWQAAIEQPRAAALGRRVLGNQHGWEFKIKVAEDKRAVSARKRCVHGA